MTGHSRSKNGVASLADARPSTTLLSANVYKDVGAGHKAGHDDSHYRRNAAPRAGMTIAENDD
jgi:hypothetical protein